MKTNITIVTYNRLNLTKICVESLLSLTEGDYCVHIVDNGSDDGTLEFLKETALNDKRVQIIRLARNMGVAIAANLGWVQNENLPYVKLDNDIEILSPDWLNILLEYMRLNPALGMIGYKFINNHQVRKCQLLPSRMQFWDFDTCGGACVLIPPYVHNRLGFWTEDYGKYGFEDLDYGRRCHVINLLTGYVPYKGKTRHLGYKYTVKTYEDSKKRIINSEVYGEKIYLLNKLLFDTGVRDICVIRKMLPYDINDSIIKGKPVRFYFNPKYLPVSQILSKVNQSVVVDKNSHQISFNLSEWKSL